MTKKRGRDGIDRYRKGEGKREKRLKEEEKVHILKKVSSPSRKVT